MEPVSLYRERIERFSRLKARLQKLEDRLSMARLITFVFGWVLFFILLSRAHIWAWTGLVASMTLFAALVRYYTAVEKSRRFNSHLETINRREINCLEGDFSVFEGGSSYIRYEHSYSYDLDLFGPASVYQYLNRTVSKPAADKLAAWLLSPAKLQVILDRQAATGELASQIDWRQTLIVNSYDNKNAMDNPESLLDWLHSPNTFRHKLLIRMISLVLSGIMLATTILVIIGWNIACLMIPLLASIFINFYFARRVNRLHERVTHSANMLNSYAGTLQWLESPDFNSGYLDGLQKKLMKGGKASEEIRKLSKQLDRLDTRLNVLVSIPLNLFLFWDIHLCYTLEDWKEQHVSDVPVWLDTMAEFEALVSFANMAFNNPTWAMPKVLPEYFRFEGTDLGHPLIPESRRVTNSICIQGKGKAVVITGSNMSGKSTFLRTCGVNAVLALAGAPVCAASLSLSNMQVFSSMRINDSIEDNTSTFYAELKRLATMITAAEQNQHVMLLLDEILRGTNSNDRYAGSVALIRQLIEYGSVIMVATHDLRLTDMARTLPQHIENYHFDVKVQGEELFFDYRLTPGICTSMNASLLMKKMGIRIERPEE